MNLSFLKPFGRFLMPLVAVATFGTAQAQNKNKAAVDTTVTTPSKHKTNAFKKDASRMTPKTAQYSNYLPEGYEVHTRWENGKAFKQLCKADKIADSTKPFKREATSNLTVGYAYRYNIGSQYLGVPANVLSVNASRTWSSRNNYFALVADVARHVGAPNSEIEDYNDVRDLKGTALFGFEFGNGGNMKQKKKPPITTIGCGIALGIAVADQYAMFHPEKKEVWDGVAKMYFQTKVDLGKNFSAIGRFDGFLLFKTGTTAGVSAGLVYSPLHHTKHVSGYKKKTTHTPVDQNFVPVAVPASAPALNIK